MIANPSDSAGLRIETFLPVLLTSGPCFMLIGLQGAASSHPWFDVPVAAVGTIMLSVGLARLFVKQVRLERRLDELEKQAVRVR